MIPVGVASGECQEEHRATIRGKLGGMLLLALVGCGQLAFLNQAPVVTFVSPESGALVSYTGEVVFQVQAFDDWDPLGDLGIAFLLADGSPIDGELTLDAGSHTATFTTVGGLPRGEPEIIARVTDTLGESESVTRTVLVHDDVAPTIAWATPVEGGRYAAGSALPVTVGIDDPDPLEDTRLVLSWTGSAVQGVADLPSELAESGDVSVELESLAITHWTIGLTVSDPLGAQTTSTIGFDVVNGDLDNDAYLDVQYGGDDCDDGSGGVHPGATERCNEVDDDCDGIIDEEAVDAPVWYADKDGDGFGDKDDRFASCAQPAGRVDNDDDCDDDAVAVFPGAPEECNHRDDDCDDIDDNDAIDTTTVWYDFDEDGYGSGDAYAVCFPTVEEALLDGDCDDGDDDIYPGAPEVCDVKNDDEDCDALAEDADGDSTGKTDAWFDADGDNRGDPALAGTRCDLGADWADNAEDCDDTDAAMWTDRAEVCEDGLDYDCDSVDPSCRLAGTFDLFNADATLRGDTFAGLGLSFAVLGDVDSDGKDDFAVGALLAGQVYVVRGAGLADGLASDWPTVTGTGSDALGEGLVGVGDLDGDGIAELLAGAPDADGDAGAVYLFAGDLATDVDADDATASRDGDSPEQFGSAVAGPGDFDGDGLAAEVAVSGVGFVLTLDAALDLVGTWTGGLVGAPALAMVTDVDGDGLDEVLVGDARADTAWLVLGGGSGDLDLETDADAVYTAAASGDSAGWAVAGAGDLTGDGLGDFVVGAPDSDAGGVDAGEAYVIFGAASVGDRALDGADARLLSPDAGDGAGSAVAGIGDADGDGLSDLVVGAPYDDAGGPNAGGAWLVYGAATFGSLDLSTADVSFVGESMSDNAGEGVGRVGDVDGDGFADVSIGAPSAVGDGRVYLFLGGGL